MLSEFISIAKFPWAVIADIASICLEPITEPDSYESFEKMFSLVMLGAMICVSPFILAVAFLVNIATVPLWFVGYLVSRVWIACHEDND